MAKLEPSTPGLHFSSPLLSGRPRDGAGAGWLTGSLAPWLPGSLVFSSQATREAVRAQVATIKAEQQVIKDMIVKEKLGIARTRA